MKPIQPSLRRIIESDYVAYMCFILPVFFWIFYAGLLFFRNSSAGIIYYVSIAASVVGVPLLLWRIWLINVIFNNGVEIAGEISDVWFYRDRGHVKYEYPFEGHPHTSRTTLHRIKRTRSLSPGDQVTLIVDRNKPGRALIRDFYV